MLILAIPGSIVNHPFFVPLRALDPAGGHPRREVIREGLLRGVVCGTMGRRGNGIGSGTVAGAIGETRAK